MINKKQMIIDVLFFGAIWGILEATVGYLLHFVPTFLAGTIMFPIASILLLALYKKTNSKVSLLFCGIVAATIKSVNLLFPAYNIWKTINPMVSIVFEALMVFAVVKLLSGKKLSTKLIALPIASIGWRLLYIGFMGVQYLMTGFLANHLSSFAIFFEFVVISGFISGVVATLFYLVFTKVPSKELITRRLKPVITAVLLVVAVTLTILL